MFENTNVPYPLPRRIGRLRVSIASPLTRPYQMAGASANAAAGDVRMEAPLAKAFSEEPSRHSCIG
jgi:hypothetical protein